MINKDKFNFLLDEYKVIIKNVLMVENFGFYWGNIKCYFDDFVKL